MESKTTTELFTEKSDAYARYRPGYPEEALDKILEPFKQQSQVTIADIGAGPATASRLLADRGAQVHAVEPNRSMIQSAETHPNVTFYESGAESIPLEDNSVDIVTSFQAFHWFDFKKSLQEFRRVLKPAGCLALVWNYWDTNDPFTSAYADLINKASARNSGRIGPYDGFRGKVKELRVRLLWKFQYLPAYKNVTRHQYRFAEKTSLQDLIGSARSQSYLLHEGKPWEELVENIRELHGRDPSSAQLAYDINLFMAEPT